MTRLPALSALLLGGCIQYGLQDEDSSVQAPQVITETFYQEASPKVDILWVIDSTGSMVEEQAALASSFYEFIRSLEQEPILWQLGVITMDVTNDQAGHLQGDPWIITSEQQDPLAAFQRAANVGTKGSTPEAAFRAIELALSPELRAGPNLGFRRDDAVLHVIALSDSDDQSDTFYTGDPLQAFLDLMALEQSRTGQPALFSAVSGEVPLGCVGASGAARAGTRYLQAAESLGGAFASICDPDFSTIEANLGSESIVYESSFFLQASAIESSIRVMLGGTRQEQGWSYQASPPAIVFDPPPPAESLITVYYTLAQDLP